jgi:exodeoxyribonuclease-3
VKVLSWNVNGLRAAMGKGFGAWLSGARAAVVGVQEVRAAEHEVDVRSLGRWKTSFVAAEKPGYSGVGLLARREPDDVETKLGEARFDAEGRFQLARFGELTVVNAYFPNGNGKERDGSRIPYKLDFYRAVYDRLAPRVRAGGRVIVMGDFNTAHRPIDLARPKQNEKTSGFRPEEREELDRWLTSGFVDTFRHFEKGEGHYSWWSQRFGVREKNIGWRIDYVLASHGAMPFVKKAMIERNVTGSDHCPVGVVLDEAVTARA